jgi:hypothetical protein
MRKVMVFFAILIATSALPSMACECQCNKPTARTIERITVELEEARLMSGIWRNVIVVSSPNTPGYQSAQEQYRHWADKLEDLLAEVIDMR